MSFKSKILNWLCLSTLTSLSCPQFLSSSHQITFHFYDRLFFTISLLIISRFLRFQEHVVKWLKHFTNKALVLRDYSWLGSRLLTPPFNHPFSVDLLRAVARNLSPAFLFDPYTPVPPQKHPRIF